MSYKNIRFLAKLEKQVHYLTEHLFQPNIFGVSTALPFPITADNYHYGRVLTKEEIEKVLGIVKEDGLLLYPINTAHGFQVGFNISKGQSKSGELQERTILRFLEKQLPEGYDFKKLSEIFLTEENRTRMRELELGEIMEREFYEY